MESIITFIKDYNILVQGVLIILGFIVTFGITTLLVKRIVIKNNAKLDADGDGKVDVINSKIIRDGLIIGKCENIIILNEN